MPFDETVAVLRGIYGDKFDAIFKEIDPKPLQAPLWRRFTARF